MLLVTHFLVRLSYDKNQLIWADKTNYKFELQLDVHSTTKLSSQRPSRTTQTIATQFTAQNLGFIMRAAA